MEPNSETPTPRSRRRNIDWVKVRDMANESPGTAFKIGVMDQSIRTHIRKGRISYINPALYDVWTVKEPGTRTRASLFIRRKCDQ